MFEDKVRVLKFQQTRNYKQITSGNQRESFFVQRFFAVKEMLRLFVFYKNCHHEERSKFKIVSDVVIQCFFIFYKYLPFFVPIILSFLTDRKERITCTPTRKKRMRLLRSASTHFVRFSGLSRATSCLSVQLICFYLRVFARFSRNVIRILHKKKPSNEGCKFFQRVEREFKSFLISFF